MDMKDLTIITIKDKESGIYTGYIHEIPGVICQSNDLNEIRKKLTIGLKSLAEVLLEHAEIIKYNEE